MEIFDKNTEDKIKEADDLIKKGKSSLAVSILKDVAKNFPNNSYLYYLLGIARMKCGRFFLAKKALKKANDLLPRKAENLRSLGWVNVMLGNLEEGRKNLREAINFDLTNPLAYIDLAMSYFHYFEFEEGFEWIERAKALDPNNPFILQNYKIAKKMEKEFLKYPKTKLVKLKKEKLDPNAQQRFHLAVLQKFFKRKGLSKDEADEIKEELQLNGLDVDIIRTGNNYEEFPSKREILKRRKKIEKKLLEMFKKIKSPLTVKYVKDVIYNEKSHDDLTKIIAVFEKNKNLAELDDILKIINDAWNYFPHKCLGGDCPMERI